jgi:parallel beta-helix repeat protein
MTIKKNGEGIVVAYSDKCLIEEVTVKNNNYGIYLYQAGSDNVIRKVTSNSNSWGLYLHHSYDAILRDNKLQGNTYNIYILGNTPSRFVHDIDTSNKVEDNKPIIYYANEENLTVPTNAGFVGLASCTNITVKDVYLRKNGQGLMAAYSSDIKIEQMRLYKNYYGTYFYKSTGKLRIGNSTIESNSRGSYFYDSDKNYVRQTVYDSNYDSVWLQYSQEIVLDNSSIIAGNRWHLNLERGSNITLLNTTFNPNKVRTVHANTELTVKWYLHVLVLDDLGVPTQAKVTVFDGQNTMVVVHDTLGSLKWIQCIGYQQVPGLIYYQYNNYTVEVRNPTKGIFRDINMTYSRTVKFIFNNKPEGKLPEWLEFEEDKWLDIDLTQYFTDRNVMTYTTYVYQYLDIAINNNAQTANVTAVPDWCGSGTITIRIMDTHGLYIESTTRINVTPVNDAPMFIQPVPNIHLAEGLRSYTFDLTDYIEDPDYAYCAEDFEWYIEGEDEKSVQVLGENSTSKIMELKVIDPDYNGAHKLQLYIEDPSGAKAVRDLWLNITARNDKPVLSSGTVSPTTGDTGTDFEFQVTYSDIDGDLPSSVQLELDNFMYAMSELNRTDRDSTDGKLYYYKGKISTLGQHDYSFSAIDVYGGAGFSSQYNGPYVVMGTPTKGSIAGMVVDSTYELSLAGVQVTLSYADNDNPVPNGTILSDEHGRFVFEDLEPTFYSIDVDLEGYGPKSITNVLVRPGLVTTDGTEFRLSRIVPPTVKPGADTEISDVEIEILYAGAKAYIGDKITFNGTASDEDGDNLIFFWDMGDGASYPVGTLVEHNYTLEGNYNITLTVLDADGDIASTRSTFSVHAKPVEDKKVEEVTKPQEDIYGNLGWLAGSIAFIVVLLICIMFLMSYLKRRKRARRAVKKLQALKRHVQLKAAAQANAARMLPVPAQVRMPTPIQPQQIPPVPQAQPTPRVALPPTSVPEPVPAPVVEGEIVEEPEPMEAEVAEEEEEAEVAEVAEEEE